MKNPKPSIDLFESIRILSSVPELLDGDVQCVEGKVSRVSQSVHSVTAKDGILAGVLTEDLIPTRPFSKISVLRIVWKVLDLTNLARVRV